jgi:hypothetical protein
MLFASTAFAQESVGRPRIDSLLTAARADSTLRPIGSRFLEEVILLAPDLDGEQLDILSKAVSEAFADSVLRADIVRAMSDTVPEALLVDLLERHRSGALAELRRVADANPPSNSLTEFTRALGTPPRERLQLMVDLGDAQGAAAIDLVSRETLASSAHELLTLLGARLAPPQRMSDEQFDVAHRQSSLNIGLANLHRLEAAPDELIQRAIADHSSASGRWFSNRFAAALSAAVGAAAQRVAALTVVRDEPPPPSVDPKLICSGDACGFEVDWEGPEPTTYNASFGSPGALSARVLENLLNAGYRLGRGDRSSGLTIVLRPRLGLARCEFMSGTDNTACVAIADVRVEFRGKYGDLENPGDLLIRNRCGSDGLLNVDDFSMLVAMGIHHAITTPPGGNRPLPRC